MHFLLLATLSALASRSVCSPTLLTREALAEIPEYDIARRHDTSHHEEIGVPTSALLDHLHENYSHRKFIRDVKTYPGNITATSYDIPDELMDLAIRSYPMHKRHANVLKKRASDLKKRADLSAPLQKRGGVTNAHYERICGGPAYFITAAVLFQAVRFFCTQHNDYLRDFFVNGGSEPPAYTRFGPWALVDNKQADMVFGFAHTQGFPWINMAFACTGLKDLQGCGGNQGQSTGGTIGAISRQGDGNYHYSLLIGDTSTAQPFDSG
ncbi:hypothetical protein TWF730_000555 [Orbilia blumenaviensis]|uniref:Uncharacterized protein n=1 Tax=Orbilia blumenaviensis TaxID=1796055 RepID=A0AAV9VLX6_9PEZI